VRLKKLRIRNFRCYSDTEFEIGALHALVGSNNAGKSTLLRALDVLFNPSIKRITEESFHHRDLSKRIEVEAIFGELIPAEKELLSAYLRPDGEFQVMRTVEHARDDVDGESTDEGEQKFKILAHYCKPQPKIDWLNLGKVDGKSIDVWWNEKDKLVYRGRSFAGLLGNAKPKVGDWKEKAAKFAAENLTPNDLVDTWIANPQGYAGVLKGTLPHYELIPAVRDATDESKVTKTSPLGRLIYEIVRSMDAGLRAEIDNALKATIVRLNRAEDNKRSEKINELEATIRGFLTEVMPADLELEFQAPTVEMLLTTPKIYVDDGFRGSVENKGHGLQRAVIFAILRAYAKFVTNRADKEKQTLILGIEEPELYMHPTAQRTIRNVLRLIADRGDQVFFTTHSPLLVDVARFDEIVRFQPPEQVHGKIPAGSSPGRFQLRMSRMIEDLIARFPALDGKVTPESMRERYGHVYTASRNEGFFAKKVILVEGATEAYSLPIYATTMGVDLDGMGVAIVECGGKGQMDRLFRVFNELGVTCYPVFDYDLGNAEPGLRRDTKILLGLAGEPELPEPSAPVIAKRFACFARKWEEDLGKEIPKYSELVAFGAKRLGGSASKPLLARFVAAELSKNKFVPPTVEAIIRASLAASHGGSCLATRAAAGPAT
jgi:predicted ATP-dependent endonuclease of OLD family